MAEIRVQQKSAGSVWAWILGLIVLMLVIWAALELFTDDEVAPIVAPADPMSTSPAAGTGSASLGDVVADPAPYIGRAWAPPVEVTVSDVVSDRGFWITHEGNRLFVVLNDAGAGVADAPGQPAQRPRIVEGSVLRIEEGSLRDPANLSTVSGPLDERTRAVAESQRIFLLTNASEIEVVGQP